MANEIISGIYKIENTVNGKTYVGSAAESIAKSSISRTGAKRSTEMRARMSLAQRARYCNVLDSSINK